jgi:electron transport complex protein RnfC
MPQELYWHAKTDNFAETQRYHIFDCIECGCCSYVCPSTIPLVQYFRYAKTQIAAEERKRDGADHSRMRFLQRRERLGEEEDDSASPNEPGAGPLNNDTDQHADKKAYIDEAVARTREKRKAGRIRESDDDNG